MKLRILLYIFLLQFSFNLRGQDKYLITWDYPNHSFKEFAANAEKLLNVKFFYKDEWISDLSLRYYPGVNTLSGVLDSVFRGRPLYYFIDATGKVVITRDFAVRVSEKQIDKNNKFIPPTEYADYQGNQNKTGNIFVELGNPADRNKPGNVVITGYITNKDTKEPIAGVTVFVQKLSTGTISNAYGYYTLTLPRGLHLLQFSFIGLKGKLINLNLSGEGELNVEMNSVMIPLKETIVSAQKSITLQRFEVGVEKINIRNFRLLPTSMGESDIIKSVLLIPGVQSVGEGSAGFNVRGGSADQNLILLYGAPIYNSSHFFGFFSAVNSDIIKDVTLYKGGIPSRYGGRLASVLDIGSKDGNRNEFDGNAGISPVTTHLMIEGPIKKDTCYYIFSGRTTYSNWILGLLNNPALKKSAASFSDFNGKVTYDISKNNKIDISGYYSNDSFKFNSDTVYEYENSILALRWRHFFNSRFFSTLTADNSNYRYKISSRIPATEGFLLSHTINSTGLKADFNWFQGRHEFNFGADLTRYSVNPGSYKPSGDSSLVTTDLILKEKAVETAMYFEDKLNLTDYLSINAGLRFSGFFVLGPKKIFLYDQEFPRTGSTVTDTLIFRSHLPYKTYFGPELRLSLNFRLSNVSSLKVNYNRTHQYLHLLSNTTSISPSDTWKLSDYYFKPQTGDQYTIGFYRMLSDNSIETSAEIYFKEIKNIPDFKGGTNLIMDHNIEKDMVIARGRSYGLELLIKRTEGKIQGSISYTYSRTFLKTNGKFSDEIINGGNWYPSNYDRPNDLIVTFNYLLSRRFSFSANYIFSTGRPITYPVSSYYIGDMLLIDYSNRNQFRLPDYSRLDISFKVSGNLRSKKIANPFWNFSVYNLLSRENVYSIYFKNYNNMITGYKLSVFGKAIPTVTFSFDF